LSKADDRADLYEKLSYSKIYVGKIVGDLRDISQQSGTKLRIRISGANSVTRITCPSFARIGDKLSCSDSLFRKQKRSFLVAPKLWGQQGTKLNKFSKSEIENPAGITEEI
jgi:hypothetical protein